MHDKNTLPLGMSRSDAQTSGRLIAVTLLRQALGFRDCPVQALEDLVTRSHVITLGKGETVVRRGEPFDKLCFVIEGTLEVSVLHANGRRFLLAYLHPADVAGMMSLWDQMPHPSDLIARENGTRVLIVNGEDWRIQHARHRSLGQALQTQMAYRSRLLQERVIVDSSMSLEMRLARLLYLLSALSGNSQSSDSNVPLKLSQSDIGDLLGVGRPRVNLAVQQLKKEGLIAMGYATVSIVNPDGLAQLAGL
jgi:CRP/FNR family transcriptional regulator, cyclic AMP receptor protein